MHGPSVFYSGAFSTAGPIHGRMSVLIVNRTIFLNTAELFASGSKMRGGIGTTDGVSVEAAGAGSATSVIERVP